MDAGTTFSLTLLLVAARAAGVLLVAPVLGHASVPARLRLLLGVAIALAVTPRVASAAVPTNAFDLAAAAAVELLTGATLGFAAKVIFSGVEVGAFHVGQQMGITLADVFDPAGESSDSVRRLFELSTIVAFFAIGGHRELIAGLLRSFQQVPLRTFAVSPSLAGGIVSLMATSFSMGLKLAAPVLVAMLLATAAMGMLQRAVPQCHILSVELPVRAMLGLLVLAASVSAVAPLLDAGLSLAMRQAGLAMSGTN
jgi:flagellar biosynthetic protein FliR